MEKRCENMIDSWIKELSVTRRSHNTAKVYLHDLQKFIGYVYRYSNERKPLENHIQTHLSIVSSQIFNKTEDEKHDYDKGLELVKAMFKLEECDHFKKTINQEL